MTTLLWYTFIASALSLAGGFLVLWKADLASKITIPLISFGAGAFMGVSFLDILPEAVESAEDPHSVFIAVLAGFFAFFFIERLFMRYAHRHGEGEVHHSEHATSLPYLVVLGDSMHNFLDGIAIAISYVANPALGLTTTIAVVAHEVPQEIADFSILLDSGWSKKRVAVVNIASALIAVAGAVLGFYSAGFFEAKLPYLLAVTAGIFIYLGASDLIPEIQDRAKERYMTRIILSFLIGAAAIGYLSFIAHGQV